MITRKIKVKYNGKPLAQGIESISTYYLFGVIPIWYIKTIFPGPVPIVYSAS